MKAQRSIISVLAIAILISSLWASTALAIPSSYTLSGYGYGDLNGGDPVFNEVAYNINLQSDASSSVDKTSVSGITYILGLSGSVTLGPDAYPEPANTIAYNQFAGNFTDSLYLSFDTTSNILEFGAYDSTAGDVLSGVSAFWTFAVNTALNLETNSSPFTYFVDSYFDPANATGNMLTPEFEALMSTGDVLILGADTMAYSAVPEPSTFILIGIGLAGLGIARRVRSRKEI